MLASKKLTHPEFPRAEVHTPVVLKADASNEPAYMQERFGPISTVVAVPGGSEALAALSERIVRDQGALTVGMYSTRPEFIDAMTAATQRAGVALSINLLSGVFVNQSAGFSDYHGTGDHWDKIDYDNFAKVTGTLAVTVLRIADSASSPKWNEANAKTARYVDAWKKLHSQPVHAGGATH